MNRREFEVNFFNPENSLYRRAMIMYALANGPDWDQWKAGGENQMQPNFYNDLAFVACYQIYRNGYNKKRTIQMRDFLLVRNSNDAGFLIDPMHKSTDARTHAKAQVRDTIVAYQQMKDPNSVGVTGPAPGISQEDFERSVNVYNAVYSEMWTFNGSMRAFIQDGGIAGAIRNLGRNVAIVNSSPSKSFWLNSLIARFSGNATTSAPFGCTFAPDKLGLQGSVSGPMLGGHRTRFVIGGHRG